MSQNTLFNHLHSHNVALIDNIKKNPKEIESEINNGCLDYWDVSPTSSNYILIKSDWKTILTEKNKSSKIEKWTFVGGLVWNSPPPPHPLCGSI